MSKKPKDKIEGKIVDCCIAGGGYVGLATAVALKSCAPHLDIVVLDAAPMEAIHDDERAFAIADAATKMLDYLGVWADIRPQAEPILEMVITDSSTNDSIRPVFLTFDSSGGDNSPFAYMVANRVLIEALRKAADKLKIEQRDKTKVESFTTHPSYMEVNLQSKETIQAKLLIAADGVRSQLRKHSGIRVFHKEYNQTGIVTTIAHEKPHNGKAQEHFLPAGPFATLPLVGNRSCLVWSEHTPVAQKILKASKVEFQLELEKRFGNSLGKIEVVGKKNGFPLSLTLAREFVQPRFALVGDAAHGIHPIAGQGLNLGFKDAAALTQTLVEAERLGLDIGSLSVLERYQQWRRFDTVRMGVMTDALNQLFSGDNQAIRLLRTVGLGIVERLPWLKEKFIAQAAGREPDSPALLKGQDI